MTTTSADASSTGFRQLSRPRRSLWSLQRTRRRAPRSSRRQRLRRNPGDIHYFSHTAPGPPSQGLAAPTIHTFAASVASSSHPPKIVANNDNGNAPSQQTASALSRRSERRSRSPSTPCKISNHTFSGTRTNSSLARTNSSRLELIVCVACLVCML